MTETGAAVKPGRQVWAERLREVYPDREGDYDDDDVFYAALEEYERERGRKSRIIGRAIGDWPICS